jgi:hypothetical protein
MDIITIPQLRRTIKQAKTVYIRPRFGVTEDWITITKKVALELVQNMPDDTTPQHHEMYCDRFGTYIDDELFIG